MKRKHLSQVGASAPLSSGNHHPLLFWDCSNVADAPAVDKIRKIHVFDFDNTLFRTPGPNPSLYNDQSIGILTNNEMLHGGGWWCNPLVLRNAGDGWDVESKRGWEGLWNEDIIELMRLSHDDEDTLTIVMTGRQKKIFTELVWEMLEGKGLKYDGLVLKTGDFESTMNFKGQVVMELLEKYKFTNEITIYDDRRSHLNGFQVLLNEFISTRKLQLIYNLVPVYTQPSYLNPKVERLLVEETIDRHNEVIDKGGKTNAKLKRVTFRKSFLYTGYTVSVESRVSLINYLLGNFKDYFTEEVLNTSRFQIEFIPFSRSLLPKNVSVSLEQSPQVEWVVKEFGYDDDVCAVVLEPVQKLNIDGFKSQLPSILPVCGKGKSTVRPVDDFLKINHWLPVKDELKIDGYFGPVILFKIAAETTSTKRQKSNTVSYHQSHSLY